jgi:hypothetical protein
MSYADPGLNIWEHLCFCCCFCYCNCFSQLYSAIVVPATWPWMQGYRKEPTFPHSLEVWSVPRIEPGQPERNVAVLPTVLSTTTFNASFHYVKCPLTLEGTVDLLTMDLLRITILCQTGPAQNGLAQKRFAENGFAQNGFTQNYFVPKLDFLRMDLLRKYLVRITHVSNSICSQWTCSERTCSERICSEKICSERICALLDLKQEKIITGKLEILNLLKEA